jgi:hypothetical protein
MSRTITVPDELYARLEEAALRLRGRSRSGIARLRRGKRVVFASYQRGINFVR